MDGIRKEISIAIQVGQYKRDLDFGRAEDTYTNMEMVLLRDASVRWTRSRCDAGVLRTSLPPWTGERSAVSSLRAVVILRDGSNQHAPWLRIDKQLFEELYDGFMLDPLALFFYLTKTDGFHPCSSPLQDAAAAQADERTYYLANPDHTIMWTYVAARRSTKAIIIVGSQGQGERLLQGITSYPTLIANPLFPAFLSCAQSFAYKWENYYPAAETLRQPRCGHDTVIEKVDFPIDGQSVELHRHAVTQLDFLSKKCHHESVVAWAAERMLCVLRSSLSVTLMLQAQATWDRVAVCGVRDELLERTTRTMRDVLPCLRAGLEGRITGYEDMLGQARDQVNMAMQRITRTDAVTARCDSSAMKVIAVMTMAFLPATFFATLFAMPSLANASLVRVGLGGYLAVTLPATALVFVLWGLATCTSIPSRLHLLGHDLGQKAGA